MNSLTETIVSWNEMDEILPDRLFIGSSRAASDEQDLLEKGFTSVVNCARGIDDPDYYKVKGYKFGFTDGTVIPEDRELSIVLAAFTTIQLILAGEKVLLHCAEGISRSVAVGILVVSYLECLDLRRAWDLIGEKRPIAYPHKTLVRLLPTLQQKLEKFLNAAR